MTDWTITRDGTTESELFDIQLTDTLNPFGDLLTFFVDDTGGTKFEQYSRGTAVDASVTPAGKSSIDKFSGYVIESREADRSGADVLEVEAYSYGQFLRRDQVNQDLSGQLISDALERIIKDETPVAWNASKVAVGDDKPVTRTFEGETVETAIRDLSFMSENEEFGVDDDLEFFFREREPGTISRGIDNTEWTSYDIPELGKDVVNEVEVWYNDGNDSVVVDNPQDKLELQDALGLPDPGRQRDEINRPQITDRADAEAEGRSYLRFRQETLTGTVTTFGLFEASPGDTIDITITPRGIDDEFRVAGVEYRWLEDETILTIVENRETTNAELLFRLNETVDRVEMESADRTASPDRVVSTEMTALVEPSGTVTRSGGGTTSAGAARFVNDGRNLLREAWADRDTFNNLTVVVGDDRENLSRTNTGLENQTNSATAGTSSPDSTTARYTASISQSGVREIGVESDGTLIARLTFDEAQDITDVEIDLTVSNDGGVDRGVVTSTGQTTIRDLLIDNSPSPPKTFAFGTDDTMPSESDTALGNQVQSYELDTRTVQSVDSTSEWENVT